MCAGVAILLGGHTGDPLEYFGEILHIHDTAVLGNGLDLQTGGFQQVHSVANPALINMVGQGYTGFFPEQAGQVAAADIQRFCQCAKTQIIRKICIDKEDSLLHRG